MANGKTVRARKRTRVSGKYDNGPYIQMPHRVFRSREMQYLQREYPLAAVLLFQMMSQHNGSNNGDLAVAVVRDQWKSTHTLYRCVSQLMQLGWIIKTRHGQWGHKNSPALYALAWLPIDECNGKLELAVSTTKPLDTWREFNGMPVGGDTENIPKDIYKGVPLWNQENRASSSTTELNSSSTTELSLVPPRNKEILAQVERGMIDYCQKLPTKLKVPRWTKREHDEQGNTMALHFDWPASTMAAA